MRFSPYAQPVNTGVILWFPGAVADRFFDAWWNSSTDAYGGFEGFDDEYFRKSQRFRWHWPWEQDRMVDIVNNPDRAAVGRLVQTIPNALCKHGGATCNTNTPSFGPTWIEKLTWLWKVSDGASCESLQTLVTNGWVSSRNNTPCYINHFTDQKEDLLNYKDPGAASRASMLQLSMDHMKRRRAEFISAARSILQGRRVQYLRYDLGGSIISNSTLTLPSNDDRDVSKVEQQSSERRK